MLPMMGSQDMLNIKTHCRLSRYLEKNLYKMCGVKLDVGNGKLQDVLLAEGRAYE